MDSDINDCSCTFVCLKLAGWKPAVQRELPTQVTRTIEVTPVATTWCHTLISREEQSIHGACPQQQQGSVAKVVLGQGGVRPTSAMLRGVHQANMQHAHLFTLEIRLDIFEKTWSRLLLPRMSRLNRKRMSLKRFSLHK
jgi:hypothetical protein